MVRLLIRGATVIDGNGGPPRRGEDVLVQDGRIAAVGPAGSLVADRADVIDASSLTILPGLINMHGHLGNSGAPGSRALPPEPDEVLLLRAARNARVSLASGVTTLRDTGCRGRSSQTIRDAIAGGLLVGPRIVSCGRIISFTGGHGGTAAMRADNAEELKKAARTLAADGVDAYKVAATGGGGTPGSNVGAATYTADELKVLMAEARRLGKRVAAHAIGTAGIRNAVEAGVDTIEHCGWMSADGRLEVDESAVELMLERGTTVVPTMTVWYRSAYDDLSTMSEDRKKMRAVREERTAAWAAMHRAGVRFATGPDTGVDDTYWDNLAWELELMAEKMGVTPMEAIVAATRNSAIGLGLEGEVGTIEPGKLADLLLVDGDPLADLGALRRVSQVYRGGKLVVDRGFLLPEGSDGWAPTAAPMVA